MKTKIAKIKQYLKLLDRCRWKNITPVEELYCCSCGR